MLRAIETFSPRGYEMAAAMHEDTPFRHIVRSYPMLGAELEHAADDLAARRPNNKSLCVLSSPDPIAEYINNARAWAAKRLPNLTFDDAAARFALDRVGPIIAPHRRGLMDYHIALFSFAPPPASPPHRPLGARHRRP